MHSGGARVASLGRPRPRGAGRHRPLRHGRHPRGRELVRGAPDPGLRGTMSPIGSTAPRSETTGFRWGSETVRMAGSIPFLQYEPRRRRLPELLLDATRWGSRVHLVHGRRRITFAAFQPAVAATPIELRRPGAGPPDPVLHLAPNSPHRLPPLTHT